MNCKKCGSDMEYKTMHNPDKFYWYCPKCRGWEGYY